MKVLARRNLQRGLALGLPSGQGMAKHFRVQPMTSAQLTQGLPANEIAALNAGGQVLLKKSRSGTTSCVRPQCLAAATALDQLAAASWPGHSSGC